MKVAIGIDPGKEGGIVVLDMDGKIVDMFVMPLIPGSREYDEQKIRRILSSYDKPKVFLEGPSPSRDWSIKAIAYLFECVGLFKGICVGLNIPYVRVFPQVWQKFSWSGVKKVTRKTKRKLKSGLYATKTDPKGTSAVAAMRLFPGVDFRMIEEKRYKDNAENRRKGIAGTIIPNKKESLHDGVIDAILIAHFGSRKLM